MTRLMYDAVNVEHIPADWAGLVAGYLDGALLKSTLPALRARFPRNQTVTIAVHPGQVADVADCEKGDFRPEQIPPWCQAMRALGRDPTAYADRDRWDLIKQACAAAHVDLPWWWLAEWDGVPELDDDPRCVAKQYTDGIEPADAPNRVPGCDTSVIAERWPGVDPDPSEEDDMAPIYLVTDGPLKGEQFHTFGTTTLHHIDGPTSTSLQKQPNGAQLREISGWQAAKLGLTAQS